MSGCVVQLSVPVGAVCTRHAVASDAGACSHVSVKLAGDAIALSTLTGGSDSTNTVTVVSKMSFKQHRQQRAQIEVFPHRSRVNAKFHLGVNPIDRTATGRR